MALYKDAGWLTQSTGSDFDTLHGPGVTVPHSGIYHCVGCGHEIAANAGTPFPPQNAHQHSPVLGSIRWRLIVKTK